MPTYSFVFQVLKLTERAQVLAEVKGLAVLLTATRRATRRANDTESPFCTLKLALRATVDWATAPGLEPDKNLVCENICCNVFTDVIMKSPHTA